MEPTEIAGIPRRGRRPAPSLFALSAGLLAAACGGDGAGEPTEARPQENEPTYHRDVAPVLAERCLGCHVEGGIAPFSLESYQEAGPRAAAIRQAILDRRMPPWNIDESGACHTFVDSRWLSDEELATLALWAETGAAEGDPAPPPERPAPPGLRAVGATLDMGVDYHPDASMTDDYRCFVVDPGLDADAFLVAYEVRPGEPRVVHHVILYSLESEAGEAAARALDDGEEGPGYTCFGGSRVPESRFLAGWAPGTPATRYPEGTGLRLRAGRKMVLQVHYNLHEGPLPDRTRIDLELSDTATEAAVIPVADFDLEVPPGVERAATEAVMPVVLPLTIHGIFPHMHTLGRTLLVERTGRDEDACLVDVPRWEFNWQQWYFYTEAVRLEALESVRIECVYDTRERTEPVRWGEGTQDEMCLAFLYVTL